MSRALDEAIALNEDLGRMRLSAGALVAELAAIDEALRAAEGPDVDWPWLDAIAREMSGAPAPDPAPRPWVAPVYDRATLAAMGVISA